MRAAVSDPSAESQAGRSRDLISLLWFALRRTSSLLVLDPHDSPVMEPKASQLATFITLDSIASRQDLLIGQPSEQHHGLRALGRRILAHHHKCPSPSSLESKENSTQPSRRRGESMAILQQPSRSLWL